MLFQVQKQYSCDISPLEFTLLKKGDESNVAEMFKHDILNIYYTLWSLNVIPLLQIPTNDKAQFKNGANFISHFHVGPPMYPTRVYSRLQSHITDHHKTRAWSQKHFCFTSPWVAMNRNTSFQQPGGFVSMTTAAEIQIYFSSNIESLLYEK